MHHQLINKFMTKYLMK